MTVFDSGKLLVDHVACRDQKPGARGRSVTDLAGVDRASRGPHRHACRIDIDPARRALAQTASSLAISKPHPGDIHADIALAAPQLDCIDYGLRARHWAKSTTRMRRDSPHHASRLRAGNAGCFAGARSSDLARVRPARARVIEPSPTLCKPSRRGDAHRSRPFEHRVDRARPAARAPVRRRALHRRATRLRRDRA